MKYSIRPQAEIDDIIEDFLSDVDPDWKEEITAVESPQAMETAKKTSRPPKRSGEYLKSEFFNLLKEEKTG